MNAPGGERGMNKGLEASTSRGCSLDSRIEAEWKRGWLGMGSWIKEAERGAGGLNGAWGNPEPFK